MALPGSGLIRFGRRSVPSQDAPGPLELIATLPVPMLVLDGSGHVQEANSAAEALLNLARGSILGQEIEKLIGHPLTSVSSDAPFAAYDLDLALSGARRQRADLMVAPLPDRAGWRVITIHTRIPAHLAGRRADRGTMAAVGAAAMLAHEIKNPLSGIRGAAQLLETSVDAGSRDLTRLIRDEVDRVTALIDRMEGFTDTRPLDLSPQNIHAILGHARDVALQGFARGVIVREIYDPSLPPVLGHRDAMIQILINLLKNAAEATHEAGRAGGTITLRTAYRHGVSVLTRSGGGRKKLPIEVCVIDEGEGPPASIAEHLFDPFVTSKRAGSGLGLALVDKLIADQGGIVEYAREGTPPRTVFRLLLPVAGRGA